MRLFYNSVEIGILTLHEFLGEPVYSDDGTTYLYTRYRIHCTGVINGQAKLSFPDGPAMSYEKLPTEPKSRTAENAFHLPAGIPVLGGPDGPPALNDDKFKLGVQQDRTAPAGLTERPPSAVYAPPDLKMVRLIRKTTKTNITDRAIRHRLQTPRGRLVLFTGNGEEAQGDVLLMSPRFWGSRTDAKTGPNPTLYGITEAMGDGQTYIVDFAIETFLNEADENGVSTSPLLSNRYTSRHDVDTDGFTLILVQGRAIFNMERVLDGAGRSPDDFRQLLFMPVPFGFVRGNIQVETLPDGTGVEYSYTDRQMPVHLPAAPYANATQVECTHRQILNTDTDILAGALNIYERGLGLLVNTRFFTENNNSPTPKKKRKKKPPTP